MERRVSTYRLGRGLLALWGTYQIGLGVYFLAVRPTLLPEDERAISSTLRDVLLAAPGFKTWINRVLSVLGGQALACGILLLSAVLVLRRRAASAWEIAVLATAGLPSVALMSVANFQIGSDFRWLLLAPVAVWAAAVISLFLSTRDGPRRG